MKKRLIVCIDCGDPIVGESTQVFEGAGKRVEAEAGDAGGGART